jgi:hypothetical protein
MVVHVYNSSYLGGRELKDHSWRPVQEKTNWVWWGIPIILATREAEVGGSQSKANPAKVQDPIWKTN